MRINDLWKGIFLDLESNAITEGEFLLRLVNPNDTFKFFAGVDCNKNILIALEINLKPPEIELNTEALMYTRAKRSSGSWLMALTLNNFELEQVFCRLCQDLIDAALMMPSQTALIKLFKERLQLWKKLFQNGNNGLLEKHEIKGLLAELIALENFLDNNISKLSTVTSWTGPQQADQDFIFNKQAIEIKAISPSATKVNVSSIEQLDSILPLYLWIYVLRECSNDEENSLNLINQISKIEDLLANDKSALNLFKDKLLEARYVENEQYENCCFSILEQKKYIVSDKFPKLSRIEMPIGILEAKYTISIGAIESFRI